MAVVVVSFWLSGVSCQMLVDFFRFRLMLTLSIVGAQLWGGRGGGKPRLLTIFELEDAAALVF
jgi:hypothetical protein